MIRAPFPVVSLLILFLAAPSPAAEFKPATLYKVKSTEVAWVIYDDKTRTLQIGHREGGITEYYQVPFELFGQLMKNEFMGGFVKANIYKKYPSKNGRLSSKPI
jgi:hypothetical protein